LITYSQKKQILGPVDTISTTLNIAQDIMRSTVCYFKELEMDSGKRGWIKLAFVACIYFLFLKSKYILPKVDI
jgi:hypothetical protein